MFLSQIYTHTHIHICMRRSLERKSVIFLCYGQLSEWTHPGRRGGWRSSRLGGWRWSRVLAGPSRDWDLPLGLHQRRRRRWGIWGECSGSDQTNSTWGGAIRYFTSDFINNNFNVTLTFPWQSTGLMSLVFYTNIKQYATGLVVIVINIFYCLKILQKKNPFWKPFRIFKKNKKLSVWSFSGESQDTKIKYLFDINRDQMDLLPFPCNNDADFENKNVMWHWNIKCDVVIGLFWL